MSVVVSNPSIVVSTAQPVALSSLFQLSGTSGNPAYVILNGFDRDEYTVGASGATGWFSGASGTRGLNWTDGDARETGIVFQLQSSTSRYYNSALGYLDQLTYVPSSSTGDITDLSLFGTSSQRLANAYANDLIDLANVDSAGYLGPVTIATEHGFSGSVPAQATPRSLAAVAESFVGQAWNMDGCWVLASTIAAEAGASLPVQSTSDMAGQTNGEWFAAFNGPAGTTGDWRMMVQTGDMIGFISGSGGGHITTCVAGSGSSAMLVDNIAYLDAYGNVLDSAGDGSADDVSIQAPHSATEEWSGVQASSVVIYRLDTPTVTAALQSLATGASSSLSAIVSAVDAAGKAVTSFQLFLDNANDTLTVNGATVAAYSAASAATVASLSLASLTAGAIGTADTITIRANNGNYWGDWASLAIDTVSASAQALLSSAAITPTTTVAPVVAPIVTSVTGGTAVYRFFETSDGTHFFTANASERDTLINTRPDLVYEGVGLGAASPSTDPAAEAVYRFFNVADGTHFFTASTSERDSLVATRPDMTLEGIAFYEDATPNAGDNQVYRFFDTRHGTHLFTDSASEDATILATRPDLVAEGIAFYTPST